MTDDQPVLAQFEQDVLEEAAGDVLALGDIGNENGPSRTRASLRREIDHRAERVLRLGGQHLSVLSSKPVEYGKGAHRRSGVAAQRRRFSG